MKQLGSTVLAVAMVFGGFAARTVMRAGIHAAVSPSRAHAVAAAPLDLNERTPDMVDGRVWKNPEAPGLCRDTRGEVECQFYTPSQYAKREAIYGKNALQASRAVAPEGLR